MRLYVEAEPTNAEQLGVLRTEGSGDWPNEDDAPGFNYRYDRDAQIGTGSFCGRDFRVQEGSLICCGRRFPLAGSKHTTALLLPGGRVRARIDHVSE